MTFRVLVILSGQGSNMVALATQRKDYEIIAVLSNRSDAPGLTLARQNGVNTQAFSKADFKNVADQKRAIFEEALRLNPDLIALAGYMQIVEPYFVEAFQGKLVNIHPSLLPEYPGLDTHTRVIEAKERSHGCTVHYVDNGVDTGPLIAQSKISVPEKINTLDLAKLVLEQEHKLYPWVVNHIAKKNIALKEDVVSYTSAAIEDAKRQGFILSNGETR